MTKNIKSQILIMFLVKLLKFGQCFCPNGHVVSFLRQTQWRSGAWGLKDNPTNTHRHMVAGVSHHEQNQTKYANINEMLIFGLL